MFPELPDARMDTRKPIADSPFKKPQPQTPELPHKRIFRMMAERRTRVNAINRGSL
jgi:hypothetical protein